MSSSGAQLLTLSFSLTVLAACGSSDAIAGAGQEPVETPEPPAAPISPEALREILRPVARPSDTHLLGRGVDTKRDGLGDACVAPSSVRESPVESYFQAGSGAALPSFEGFAPAANDPIGEDVDRWRDTFFEGLRLPERAAVSWSYQGHLTQRAGWGFAPTPLGAPLVEAGEDAFAKQCGDAFVHEVYEGGELLVVTIVNLTDTNDTADDIEFSDGTAYFQGEVDRVHGLSLSIFQLGGGQFATLTTTLEPPELAALIRDFEALAREFPATLRSGITDYGEAGIGF